MMKQRLKRENGISMISLVITIIILVILTNVLVYNAKDSIYLKKLNNMYSDLELLREKVSEYYNEYGKIPAKTKYTNISDLQNANVLSEKNDIGDFYVIDLEAMKGLTLTYGKQYELIKNNESNANNYKDIYIINENSHNIFYVKGVEIQENGITKKYYSDNTAADETKVDLRYVEGKMIPEEYFYIGKIEVDGIDTIVISNNKEDNPQTQTTNQYNWVNQISKVESIPNSVILQNGQKEEEFIISVNNNKGYFKNSEGKVQYAIVDENKWSEAYTENIEYTDSKGDKVTIPEGFKVSLSPTMNTVENGLVVKDQKDNEWVWVEVPEKVFSSINNEEDYEGIKDCLIQYVKNYREGATGQNYTWKDEWYDGCGLTETEYNNLYQNMLKSTYNNKGFWIGRYEAGIKDTNTLTSLTGRTQYTSITNESTEAVSQKDMIPYNWIYCSDAQALASRMSTDENRTTSLLFGIQWDLTCKFIEDKSELDVADIKTDSTDWGNNSNASFDITSPLARAYDSQWATITGEKTESSQKLLTTGASIKNKILNIYDFAGNTWEWTLEHATTNSSYNSSGRGGAYMYNGFDGPASFRNDNSTTHNHNNHGFRATMY